MTSAACEWVALSAIAVSGRWIALSLTRCQSNAPLRGDKINIVFGEADPPKIDIYGVALAAGEAAGAGEPKLKFTVGAFSAPCWAAKNGRDANPNIPAIVFVGKRRTAVLKSCTAPLKLFLSTEIRFSVPSSCA